MTTVQHPGRAATTDVPYRPGWLPTLFDLDDLRRVLDVRFPPSGGRTAVDSVPSGHGGVLGSQLLAQQVVLAERSEPGKRVQSLQTQFVRGGRWNRPIDVEIIRHHSGRSFAFVALVFRQDGDVLTTASVMLTIDEADDFRRDVPPAEAKSVEHASEVRRALIPWAIRESVTADAADYEAWMRVPEARGDATLGRALIAHASEIPAIHSAVAARGIAVPAGGTVPGNILAHTVTFTAPSDLADWHRMSIANVFVGSGRQLGRGVVADAGGRTVATFDSIGVLRVPQVRSAQAQ
ncbi:acyl-CoA thioesterase [Gordonia sp. KTR9]|uniref:acyl-CoA thioesterase n=1 Tax=Gordonia sp. KTR9 TaxID=337191 RepID=UPI00027DE9FD|nr:acyl-CoA thioesterase domain-containing protein [Gordonia sp. KTR9]AFR49440.1 Acyl-CoA thioesterase [Gordonia sp. KTR9]